MTDQRGFALIETLVAFAILTLVLIALYEAVGTGFRTFARAAMVEEAVLIAQSRLDLIAAERRLPQDRRGQIAGTPYAWSIEERPATSPQRDGLQRFRPMLFRLEISWPGSRRSQSVALERLILVVPQGSPP